LVLSKFIVLTCEQLFRYECVGDVWNYGSRLHTRTRSKQEHEPNGLVCTEKMLPIETEDAAIGVEVTQPKSHISVCDFQSYCRHKALIKRIGGNPSVLDPFMFMALGGVLAKWPNTFLTFCRKAFYDSQLEVLLSCEGNEIMEFKCLQISSTIDGPTNILTFITVTNHSPWVIILNHVFFCLHKSH